MSGYPFWFRAGERLRAISLERKLADIHIVPRDPGVLLTRSHHMLSIIRRDIEVAIRASKRVRSID